MDTVDLRAQLAAHLHQFAETQLARFDAYAAADFAIAQRIGHRVDHHHAQAVNALHQMRCHAIVHSRPSRVFEHPAAAAVHVIVVEPECAFEGDFH